MTSLSGNCELMLCIIRGMEGGFVSCLLVTRLPVKTALLARSDLAGRPFVVYVRNGRVLVASLEAPGAGVGAACQVAGCSGRYDTGFPRRGGRGWGEAGGGQVPAWAAAPVARWFPATPRPGFLTNRLRFCP